MGKLAREVLKVENDIHRLYYLIFMLDVCHSINRFYIIAIPFY